jgi:molecular chaperone GrpE (heat shock protein)
MTKEIKDGFVVHDRRFWVPDEERDETDAAEAAAPRAAASVDAETLRTALAELEEAKNRVRRDGERQLELARARILEALLPVLDNLERSIGAAATGASAPAILEGVKLVHQQFLAALGQFGLARRSVVGERFDPRVHDAVAVIPVADAHQDGVVVSELEPAYLVGERVIRPAKVQVGRAAERPLS